MKGKIAVKKDVEYRSTGYRGHLGKFVIPAGTPAIPATNLPGTGLYWAEPWEGMSEEAESWQRNYGFLLTENEVSHEH
jgi:hypothetical protein